MDENIIWIDKILSTHNVENEPLLEEQFELAKKDILEEVKKAIESEFDDPQHFCSCSEWCTCWEDFWKKQKKAIKE